MRDFGNALGSWVCGKLSEGLLESVSVCFVFVCLC